VNGRTVKTGTASGAIPLNPGANTITTLVTAPDGVTTKSYTVTVTRVPPADAELRSLGLRAPFETLTTVTGPDYRDYTASVPHGFPSIEVLPVTSDPSSTITVNGTALTSGTTSNPLPLAVGPNPITIVVTAQDGVTTETYVITVTRAPASDALLSSVGLTNPFEELTVVTGPDFRDYTASVSSGTSSIETLLVSSDSAATITVNGTAVTSGTTSSPLPLAVGPNAITILVTAQDGVTTETYVITVTRAPSSNAFLSSVGLTNPFEVLTTVTGPDYKDYTASVSSGTSSIEALPVTSDPAATLTVNGTAVTSGTTSNPLPLAVGPNAITIVVTAQDGVTTENYVITVTEAAPPAAFRPVNFTRMTDSTSMAIDGILVHQGVSPNGDGINDFLVIEGITQYPDNHLMIINRNGALVYQANGYDNSKGVFDGHSNINGRMQAQGTYFYALDYNVNGVIRHRTGYIVLKY
jgi:gliding motility-associated-like protein